MNNSETLRTNLLALENQAIDAGLEESAYGYGGAAELLGCYSLDENSGSSKVQKYVEALMANGHHATSAEEKDAWVLAADMAREHFEL